MVDGVNGNKYSYTIVRGDNLTKIAKKNNTTIEEILRFNPYIKNKNLIYAGKELILPENSKFVQKEDYSPNNMNMGKVTVNGEEVSQLGGKDLKTNFYANNLGDLSSVTTGDDNPATKIVVQMQAGKSMTRKDNDTPYSILNKTLGNYIDNNSTIEQGKDGKFKTKSTRLEDTDLYKAFISEDVNGDNFTGENNKLLSRGESGNNVQLPSVEIDKNGIKYFTLHGSKEILYFDTTGKSVTFEDGEINGATPPSPQPEPEINAEKKSLSQPQSSEFSTHPQHGEKILNLGNFYVNGTEVARPESARGNFFANNVGMFTDATLNDNSKSTRLDVQLNMGATISDRDRGANDILKKMLGNNFDTQARAQLAKSDLYKHFTSEEVNGANFKDGKLQRNDKGFNLVQFPALEVDQNGIKYYTLHSSNGTILYFNDKGEQLQTNKTE